MTTPRWRRYLRFWKRDLAADVDDELRLSFRESSRRVLGDWDERVPEPEAVRRFWTPVLDKRGR